MSRSPRRDTCRSTGKRRFRDHREATKVLRHASSARSYAWQDGAECRRREVRSYECEVCHGWHVTSWAAPTAAEPIRPRLDADVLERFILGVFATRWVAA